MQPTASFPEGFFDRLVRRVRMKSQRDGVCFVEVIRLGLKTEQFQELNPAIAEQE